jgi:N-glycosidase YbiA
MTTDTNGAILFFDKKHAFLSNFFRSPILIDITMTFENGLKKKFRARRFPTVEHAYQACKMTRPDNFEAVASARTPGEAKMLGNRLPMRRDWEDVKERLMLTCVRAKFRQNDALAQELLDTGEEMIFEGNTWNDTIWGVCYSKKTGLWTGENKLGLILMQVRGEIRERAAQV